MANNMIKKPRGLTADLGISNVKGPSRSFNKVGPSKNQPGFYGKPFKGSGRPGPKPYMEAGVELADVELGKKATGTIRGGISKQKGQPASKRVGGRVDFTIDPSKYLDGFGINVDKYLGEGQPISFDAEALLFNKRLKIRAGAELTPDRKPDFGIGAELRIPLGK